MTTARLVGAPHVIERTLRELGPEPTLLPSLGAPFSPLMTSAGLSVVPGVPDQSSDVPSFGGYNRPQSPPPGNVDAPPVNVDRPAVGEGPLPPRQDCDCKANWPWWAWLLVGTVAGGTVYGTSAYLLNK